jgi:hypothetical protein
MTTRRLGVLVTFINSRCLMHFGSRPCCQGDNFSVFVTSVLMLHTCPLFKLMVESPLQLHIPAHVSYRLLVKNKRGHLENQSW